MALITPVLSPVPYFDAGDKQIFTFTARGGDQVVANTITIKNNITLETVYTDKITSFRLAHTVPAGTLENGIYYQATITTENASGETSNESEPIQFYCYATPTFEFTNVTEGGDVGNSNYGFTVRYNNVTANANEFLNEYAFTLYSAGGAVLSTSDANYNISQTLPLDVSYLFAGLSDQTNYRIECTGVTTGGRQITTGKVSFIVKYDRPNLYSYIYLINNCEGGYITIDCNVIAIVGKTEETPIYVDDNTAIDLRNGNSVTWNDGYQISNNYTLRIWGRDFNPNTEVLKFSNATGSTASLRYMESANKVWWELWVKDLNFKWHYIIKSAEIDKPEDTEQIFAWVRNIGNLYDVIIENLGVSA